MDFGFSVPTRGPQATREAIAALAQAGEKQGYAYVNVNDHIVVPKTIDSTYPYSEKGDWPGGKFGEALEQLTELAFLAAVTERIRLLTAVMVVPHRSPVHCAKILTTIDVLSEGRLTVGCGAGWMKEEFEALQVPPFEARGRVVDEYLAVFKKIWTEPAPTVEGEFVRFSNVSVLPLPIQKPHPPLWIGGESLSALRRAVRLGDAWFPIGNNPKFPMETAGQYAARLEILKRLLGEAGRDPASLTLAYAAQWSKLGDEVKTADGGRRLFTGSADAILDDIGRFGELGVRHLLLNFQSRDLSETLEKMQAFTDQVMSKASA